MFRRKFSQSLRLLFVTDLHASEITFRKMLNAVKVYEATVLIVGGDLAGKRIVPILSADGVYTTSVSGNEVRVDETGLNDLMNKIRDLGQYPFVVDQEEHDALASDPEMVDRRFTDASHAQIEEWLQRMDDRFEPLGIPVYVTGGNDDYLSIEEIIDAASWVVNAENKIIEIGPGIEMLSTGFGNPTPWNCPRDIPEDQLLERITALAEQLSSPETSVFNLHAPPYASGLDEGPLLDTSVTPPRAIVGETDQVGSRAVRETIERYQPILSLHGHIHESRGIQKIGRTTCVNPGSEYTEGILRSAVADFGKPGEMSNVQLLSA